MSRPAEARRIDRPAALKPYLRTAPVEPLAERQRLLQKVRGKYGRLQVRVLAAADRTVHPAGWALRAGLVSVALWTSRLGLEAE
jgi:hypothetical protein